MTSHKVFTASLIAICAAAFVTSASTRALANPVEAELPTSGTDASVGFRDTGAFMTCWLMPVDEEGVTTSFRVVVQRYTSAGAASGGYDHASLDSYDINNTVNYEAPSMSVSRYGTVGVACTGTCRDCQHHSPGPLAIYTSFAFGSTPNPATLPSNPVEPLHAVPSIGISNAGETALVYVAQNQTPQGLLSETSVSGDDSIETCVDNPGPGQHYCFWTIYEPSVSQRSDGRWAVAMKTCKTSPIPLDVSAAPA
jgi:hypothetical protein